MTSKEEYTQLLLSVGGSGTIKLVEWLSTTDFFEAPASTKYHGNYSGGLIDHCLNVYHSLHSLHHEYIEEENRYDEGSIILVSLLHDLCKIDFYYNDAEPATEAQLSYAKSLLQKECDDAPMPPVEQCTKKHISDLIAAIKEKEPNPTFKCNYKVRDLLPMGHGEKSLYLAQKYIWLSDDEALAIRWHLGSMDPGYHFHFPTGVSIKQAMDKVPLVSLLISADFLASRHMDMKVG